jgi:WD40 repeat protein
MSLSFTPDKPTTSFTIALVKALDPHFAWLEARWSTASLSVFQFTHFVHALIRTEMTEVRPASVSAYPGPLPSADELDTLVPPPDCDSASEVFVAWERKVYLVHDSPKVKAEFTCGDAIQYWLCATFREISSGAPKPTHTFSDFRAYILNCTMGNGSSENDVKAYSVSRTFPCRALWRMSRLEVFEEFDIIVSASLPDGEVPAIVRVLDASTLTPKMTRRLAPEQGVVQSLELVPVFTASSMALGGKRMKALLLLVATADGYLRAYDCQRDLHLQLVVGFPETISCVFYARGFDTLALGTSKGATHIAKRDGLDRASVVGETTGVFPIALKLAHHADSITCMETEALGESIFTASLDRTIVQFAARTGAVLRRMTGHRLGVLSMCYNRFYHTLLTCGLEYALYAWPLEVNNPVPTLLVDTLAPYSRSVVTVRTLPRKPIAITMDTKGLFKVWDLRSNRCVATVPCEPELSRSELDVLTWHWFSLGKRSATIVTAANRKCYLLEYDVDDGSKGAYQAHESPITGFSVRESADTIITCGKTDLHLWGLLSCESVNHIRDIDTDPVTCMLDFPDAAAIVVGTAGGTLKLYSTASFAVQAIWVHQSQSDITSLCALGNSSFVAIGGPFGRLEVIQFDAKSLGLVGKGVERNGAPIQATAVTHYPAENALLVGEPGNLVTVWRQRPEPPLDAARLAEKLRVSNPQVDRSVTAIAAVPDCNSFLCGDSGGWVNVFATDDEHIWRLYRFSLPRTATSTVIPGASVIRLLRINGHLLAAFGDDYGQVSLFDPAPMFGTTNNERGGMPRNADIPRAARVRQEVAAPVKISHFEAHPEAAVTSLELIGKSGLLVTGGTDCRVQLSTLMGTHVAYYLLSKIGVGLDEVSGSVSGDKDWNDLPPPFGNGSAAAKGGVDEVLHALSFDESLNQAPQPSDSRQRATDALNGTTRSLRRRYRPFRKTQSVIERAPTLVFEDNDEILYHVPQYIGTDHAAHAPPHCPTQEPAPVRRALYGPSAEFKSLNHHMLRDASDAAQRTLPCLARSQHRSSSTPPPRLPPLAPGGGDVGALSVGSPSRSVAGHSLVSAASPPVRSPIPTASSTPGPNKATANVMTHAQGRLRKLDATPQPASTPQFFVPNVRSLVGVGGHSKSHKAKEF